MRNGNRVLHKKIFAALLSGGLLLLPNWGYALPSGGQVVTNNGKITNNGNVMEITGSGNVAINWDSFNIAANETVNFQNMQAVLNYVSGGSKSEIFGKLNGSGVNVFLVNPNGILFGQTAQVNVGQLTASTRNLEKNTLNGFNGSMSQLDASSAANVKADIINLGKLTVGKLVLEGNNLSIIGADSLQVENKSQITLRAKENINIGYEVIDKTTIDVSDGHGNIHRVSDYGKGGGTKASSVLSGADITDLTGSTKSINDAMLVHDVYELQAIDRNNGIVNGDSYVVGNYMLAGDIDASDTSSWNNGRGFEPIGRLDRSREPAVTGSFIGNFDGMCYSIKDLYIKRVENYDGGYIGLFEGVGKGGSVGNLNIAGGHIEGKSTFGSITGLNWGTIYNVINSAELVCDSGGVGGIAGTNGGVIRDAVNNGTLTVFGTSGGIVGSNGDTVWNNAGSLINVKNTGEVTSKEMGTIGGITGTNNANGTIIGAENTGNVTLNDSGGSKVGGISGGNYGRVEDVKNSGTIRGHIYENDNMGVSCVGGIVGENNKDAIIRNAENCGNISGDNTIGGIAGSNAQGLMENTRNISGKVFSKNMSIGGVTGNNTGAIKNSFNNAAIEGGTIYAGGVAGSNAANATISDCYNTGSVTAQNIIGGITGRNYKNASVSASYNTGAISGTKIDGEGFSQVGGISGSNEGTINGETYNTGDVVAGGYGVGGIIGCNYDTGNVKAVYNKGNVTGGAFYVGGIAGYSKSALTDVYNTGNISGASGAQYVGGIVGYALQDITNAYNTGNVGNDNAQYVGGIVGYKKDGAIKNSWNAGEIKGQKCLGGIVGYNIGNISNSYNEGKISGNGAATFAGGIAGYSKDSLFTNTYNLGKITGCSSYSDEIIGGVGSNCSIANAYYATDTGYKKLDDDSEYDSIKTFNAAFLEGMEEGDKALWMTYGERTTPLLKGLLKPLDINVGDIETEYTGSDYTGLAQAIADKLAEQGISIDVTKLLAEGKTAIGEYDLSELLYSTQDGYALNVTGKLVIKAKSPEPKPSVDDIKYSDALTYIKTDKLQHEEYRNIDKRRRSEIEQASVAVEGDGINLE